MTSSTTHLNRVVILISCLLTITSTLVNGLYVPGYNDQRLLHVCSTQQPRDLRCALNQFIFVQSVFIGYSPTDATGCTSEPTDCGRNVTDSDYWRATSYQQYGGVTVPPLAISCANLTTPQLANYLQIRYSCTSENLLSSMDMCISASRTTDEVHLTNPRWALGVGQQTLDCTCLIEPIIGSVSISATLALLYTDLPEATVCGEKTSVEDQDGNILLHHCSPGWRQLLISPSTVVDTPAGTRSLRLHFLKEHINDYPPRMTKLWYGIEATAPVKVTCGPTRTDNGAVIEPSTTEKPGLSETTMIILVGAGCGTIVLIVIAVVVACVLVRRKRPTNASTPISTHPIAPDIVPGTKAYTNPDHQQNEVEPYYSEIDLKAMGLATKDDEVVPVAEDGYLSLVHRPREQPPEVIRNPYVHDIYLSHVNVQRP